MARSISDEELQLRKRARRRLVGAIALATVAVVVVPMVLDDKPKPVGQDIAIRIPSQEGNDFATKVPPSVPKPAVPAEPAAQNPVKPSIKAAEPIPLEAPVAKPVEKASEAPVVVAHPQPAKTAKKNEALAEKEMSGKTEPSEKQASAPKSAGYVVLLGAFSSQANAKLRQSKLTSLGIRFYTEKLKTAAGEKIGVRAGPYANRHEAEQIRDKLKARGIQDGVVAEKSN